MKVNFTRKSTPSEIYPQDEFIIEKVVRLAKEEFKDLLKEPLKDRSYIKENKDKMYEDKDGYWHCIYVVSEGFDDSGNLVLTKKGKITFTSLGNIL